MSITKLAIGTYIDYAPKDPATITDRAPINIGTKEVQTTVTGTQEVLHVTALPDTSSVYSITTEGAKSIIANSFVINSIPV